MKDLKFIFLLILIIAIGLVNFIWLARLQTKIKNLQNEIVLQSDEDGIYINKDLFAKNIRLLDDSNSCVIHLGFNDNSGFIAFYGDEPRPKMKLSTFNNGDSYISLDNKKGDDVVNISSLFENAKIDLYDTKGSHTVIEASGLSPIVLDKTKPEPNKPKIKTYFQKIDNRFICKNLSILKSHDKDVRVIGEITNLSKDSFTFANFQISFYDKDNKLIDVASFVIGDFPADSTRSFTADYIDINYDVISSCRIDYHSGL